jgi:hypothetical protein
MSIQGGPAGFSGGPEQGPADEQRRLTLAKGEHRWEFSCAPGEERELLRSLTDLAIRPEVPFDWFDAALVGHQIARRLQSGLSRVDKSVDEV